MEIEPRQTNQEQTSLLKKWLTNEVKFIMIVAGFIWGFAGIYYPIKQDIALMKSDVSNINSNHEVHIQDIQQSIKDLQAEQVIQNNETQELQKQIIGILSRK